MASYDAHPGESSLERYALGLMEGEELGRIEEHLLSCEECRFQLAEIDAFVNAFRSVGGEPVTFVHDTEDGPVSIAILEDSNGRWVGRFWGAELEGRRVFPSARQAWEYVRRSFDEMFPGHRCNQRCRRG